VEVVGTAAPRLINRAEGGVNINLCECKIICLMSNTVHENTIIKHCFTESTIASNLIQPSINQWLNWDCRPITSPP
jgi:hypothetical protein